MSGWMGQWMNGLEDGWMKGEQMNEWMHVIDTKQMTKKRMGKRKRKIMSVVRKGMNELNKRAFLKA